MTLVGDSTGDILKFITCRCWIGHKLHEISLSSSPHVPEILLPKVEVFERWKSRDFMLSAERLMLGAVESSKRYFLVVCKLLCGTHVLWFGSLAVATPRSVEHDQNMLLLLEEWFEVLLSQMSHLEHQHHNVTSMRRGSMDCGLTLKLPLILKLQCIFGRIHFPDSYLTLFL